MENSTLVKLIDTITKTNLSALDKTINAEQMWDDALKVATKMCKAVNPSKVPENLEEWIMLFNVHWNNLNESDKYIALRIIQNQGTQEFLRSKSLKNKDN